MVDRISSTGLNGFLTRNALDIQNRLGELQVDIASGKHAQTQSELGVRATNALNLRVQLNESERYQETISITQSRVALIQESLTSIQGYGNDFGLEQLLADSSTPQYFPLFQDQAYSSLQDIINRLNVQYDDRFLFAGHDTLSPPIADIEAMLEGNKDGQIGFKQSVADRNLADDIPGSPGAPFGTGWLSTAVVANAVNLTDELPDFGFTLTGVNGAGMSIAPGTPPEGQIGTLDFTGLGPGVGQKFEFEFAMPDGEALTMTFYAREKPNDEPLDDHEYVFDFTAGSPANNAAFFQQALDEAIAFEAASSLKAASTVRAANNHFDDPQRVIEFPAGPLSPADPPQELDEDDLLATKEVLDWYQGDDGILTEKVSDYHDIEYGIVPSEEPSIVRMIKDFAIFSITAYQGGDEENQALHSYYVQTRAPKLMGTSSEINDIQGLLGIKERIMINELDKQTSFQTLVEIEISNIEDTDIVDASTRLQTLQTQLEVSFSMANRVPQFVDYI